MSRFLPAVLAMLFACQAAELTPIVRLNVAVYDTGRRPVEDMAATDFRVEDQRRPRPVLLSKRSARQPVLLLLDLFNTPTEDYAEVAKQVLGGLEAVGSEDRVFVYLLNESGHLDPLHGFESTARNWYPEVAAKLQEVVRRSSPTRLLMFTMGRRIRMTLGAMDEVGSHFATLPGHKNLVWISRGLPVEFRAESTAQQVDNRGALSELARTLGRADISVSTVDGSTVGLRLADQLARREMLRSLAAAGGGQHFGAGGITAAIGDVVRHAASSYTVCFRPDSATANKEQRRVRVITSRRDVQLVAPAGYPEYPTGDERTRLEGAMASLVDAGEIRVHVEAARVGARWRLLTRVEPADVLLEANGDKLSGALEFTVVSMEAGVGRSIAEPAQVAVEVPAARRAELMKEGFYATGEYEWGEEVRRVRVIVRDVRAGFIGSQTVALAASPKS